ncbi:cupin domain-containing protein [Cellulomonas sp. PhB150]|uniref:cupin domain-containing protein n=1 Tax=Cellulomonas sp. PhB150 TaxID=2485188 RepID=UPI000F47A392|nr:cupin domain-containing protein [Cellulomonas sp. PhB150]ROS30855.1 mannose-6-phosphate isomerase-like protein (cupin superfamily) [Cellulomonas sp. PhB150]
MPHLTPSSAPSRELHGVTFTSFASSRTGAAHLAAWRADFPPRTPGAAHAMSQEEVLNVVVGALDVEIDAERFTARAGDAVLVPAGARFRISNTTSQPAQAWVTTSLGMTVVMHDDGQVLAPPWAQ